MKVAFFSRCQLVHLYGGMHKYLSNSIECIHIAYSDAEEHILSKLYHINVSYNLTKMFYKYYKNEFVDKELCNLIDKDIKSSSFNEFNLNAAIQSDRTFTGQNYNSCLIDIQIYYKIWIEIFKDSSIDYFIHEPVSLMLTQLAYTVAFKYGIKYYTQIQVKGQYKFSWLLVDGLFGTCPEIEYYYSFATDRINKDVIYKYINNIKYRNTILNNTISKYNIKGHNAIKVIINIIKSAIRISIDKCIKHKHLQNHTGIDRIDNYMFCKQSLINRIFNEIYHNWIIKYDNFNPSLDYYYYPLHLEPEAVVLYWGGGWYKNQVKLIENIAAQLKVNIFLYVKDHPHGGTYRDFRDLKSIKDIPNVKLLKPDTNSLEIIRNSKGVITINGTAGYEALLMDKEIYTFGKCYYNICPNVYYIEHIKQLREYIDKAQIDRLNKNNISNNLLYFINTFLLSTSSGFTSYFLNYAYMAKINHNSNIQTVASGLSKKLSFLNEHSSSNR